MSANSPCKASKNLIGKIVLPGPVIDRSIIDSVAGFIQDVVPHVSIFYMMYTYHCFEWFQSVSCMIAYVISKINMYLCFRGILMF